MKLPKKLTELMLKKFKKGFSLIEILVVLTIFSVIAFITTSFMHQYQPTLKLKGEARKLASQLRYAQQLTMTEQKVHCLRFFSSQNKYQLVREPGVQESILAEIILAQPIRFQEITFIYADACFNFVGASSETGQLTLSNGEQTTTIDIRPSGYVKITENLVTPQ